MRRLVTILLVIPLLGAVAAPAAAQSPTTTEELLSDMVTEEVEPGVFRVTNDGVRDLMQAFGVYIGDDGSVWGVQRDGIFRLGGEFVERPAKSYGGIRIAPDGAAWSGHFSYDGHRWIEHEAPPGAADYSGLQYSHLDGTNWATWSDPQDSGQWIVARRDGDQWIALDAPFVPFVPPGQEVAWVDLRATDDGGIWAETAFEYSRWTDGEWQRVFVSGGPSDEIAFDILVDLTPDGSIWVHRMETPYEEEGIWIREVLRFYDGSEWLEWGDEDWASFGSGELQVVGTGPDGSLWSTTGRGVLRFDRERWSHYLPDLRVGGHGAVGPDGSVWVLAEPAEVSESWFEDDDPWYDLFVITPEAVAATDAAANARPLAEEPTVVTETAATTEELLASMRVDEASPGFFRVDHDGVRSLSSTEADRVAAGHDGGIRLLDDDGFFRLGSEETHAWPTPMPYGYAPNTNQVLEVAPDGTMWIIPVWSQPRPDMRHGSALRSTDGEEWTVQPCPGESDCQGVSVTPDGTVWASWREGPADGDGRVYLGQFGPTGWQPLDGDPPYEFSRTAFTDAGDLYGISAGWHAPLHRYVDGVWQEERFADALVDVGPDGTVWQDAGSCIVRPPGPCGQDGLVRHTGGERMGWTSAELPGIALGFGHDREFQVAPDGSVWFSRWRSADGTDSDGDELWRGSVLMDSESDPDEGEPPACDGLARFDGVTLERFLAGRCITMDIAADGSVWVLADDDLYVITPEAVAAKAANRPAFAASPPDITLAPTDDPAVFEVISEPHLEWLHADESPRGPLTIDRHDGVWVQGWGGEEGETLYVAELGVPGRTEFGRVGDVGAFWYGVEDLAFTPDGTLWGASGSAGLRSFDGEVWTRHSSRPWRIGLPEDAFTFDFRGVVDLTEAPDGTLYGITEGMELAKVEDGEVLQRDLGSDWGGMPLAARAVAITPDGTIWVGGRDGSGVGIFADTETGWLLRLDGPAVESVTPLGPGVEPYVADLAVGPDGALWALLRTEDDSYLARYDGQSWTTYSTVDGLPEVGARTFAGNGDRLAVGPDGRVCFSLFRGIPEEPLAEGDGLVVFDGESFEHYLEGVQVEDLAIASDGSAWTSTDQGLYVITPEDVAAAE